MPRGFMLYVSAAAVSLLGFGQPVPAEATDASPTAAMTTPIPDDAAAAAAAIASSIHSPSSESTASISSSTTSTANTISVTMSQPSSASPPATSSSHISSSPSVANSFDTETCQSKTINYITHTLPQQCLRTSWSSANATATTTDTKNGTGPSGRTSAAPSETASASESAHDRETKETDKEKEKGDDENQEDLATESFMSFEEWKALQLKKAGQDPAELQARRRQHQHQHQHHAGQHAHGAGGDINIDSIGDDGEIALDFDVLNEKVSEMAGSASAHRPDQYRDGSGGGYRQDGSAADGGNGAASGSGGSGTGTHDEAVVYADGATQYYRSKDAGKTGKERFSFASFDAGATVLKANKGVKNAKAILVENKDSYMLLECRTRDKHVIVELSDDILVDTVVLANFEFFSSMVRRFRVSVSDRYPVKADRWRTLGEFEARNSRDIQPFLIEHPQIWAKYIRIDFLTHYGSEYYCPISLLRVHGTRMLDSWKDSENGRDGDDDEELENHEQYEGIGQQNQNQNQYNEQLAEADRNQKQAEEHAQHAQAETIAASEASPIVDDSLTKFSADADAYGPCGYTPWNPGAANLGLFNTDAICLPSATPDGSSDSSLANADDYSALGSSQESRRATPVEAHAEINNQSSSQAPEPSASSVQPPEHASTPTHTQTAAKCTSAESASDPPHSASTSSIASTAPDASQPSQSSEPAASPSTPATKVPEQDVSAHPQAAKQKPNSVGNQQTPPTTTTVQTSHSRNRAASGGAGAAGSSSQSGGGPSGSTGGSGYNPGATPGGGGQGSASSSSGGNNNGASTGGAPSPPPPPIVQESFFKSITKRLQLLESNTSLSLQYIEDQSRFLQEALRKMERKQISRVDSFLDTLNNTVLSELRNMRQQYDQIWQSTVIALETQREQNQRETVALSDRLNVLADEVVFQKRMAILQSVLLLCCLALVIFSRGLLSSSSASVPLDVNTATAAAMAAAAGYMPAGPAMSPSPTSPPSASSSVGLRSNLRSLRNNLRNPYAAYSVYASDYPLSSYSAGSPPPPSNLRTQSMPVRGSGGASAVPAPINKNKVLPLIPTTPTSPASPGSPVSPAPILSNEGQDSLLDVDDQAPQVMQEKGKGPVLVEPKSLTPPASLRLSDIEEAADQLEDEEDSGEDHNDETVLSEATTVRPDGNNRTILGSSDSLGQFTPTAATPTKLNGTADDLSSSSMTTSFLPGTGSSEAPPEPSLGRKRLGSLSEIHSD